VGETWPSHLSPQATWRRKHERLGTAERGAGRQHKPEALHEPCTRHAPGQPGCVHPE